MAKLSEHKGHQSNAHISITYCTFVSGNKAFHIYAIITCKTTTRPDTIYFRTSTGAGAWLVLVESSGGGTASIQPIWQPLLCSWWLYVLFYPWVIGLGGVAARLQGRVLLPCDDDDCNLISYGCIPKKVCSKWKT